MPKMSDKMKKQLVEKEQQLKTASEAVRRDADNSLVEERKKFEKMTTKFQEEHDKLKDELNGELTRVRADYDEKIEDYEQRLEKALADKVEKMLVLREEVEQEYADRMDELRNMYKDEMSNQVEIAEREKERMQGLESSLQDSLKLKRQEFDELKTKYEDAASKSVTLEAASSYLVLSSSNSCLFSLRESCSDDSNPCILSFSLSAIST